MIDVLIAGAGPTGLTLAILCNRLGLSYRIIDQNSGPAMESRAIAIQARTLEIFHKLGFVEDFLKHGMRAKGAKLYLKGKKRLELDVSDMERKDTEYPFVFFLPQADTEKILLKEVRNVERNSKLIGFKHKKHHVISTIVNPNGDQETVLSRYLCGCDGSHSVVRKGLGLDFEGDSYASNFLMADCKVDWLEDHSTLKVFLESGKLAIFFPMKHSQLSRVITISEIVKEGEPNTTETTSFEASLSELEAEFKKASHKEIKLSHPKWVTRYHVHHRTVHRMREGNVFVLGDAAHIHSPVGGQGMNTGIQDANNLAWKLKLAMDHPHKAYEILETYNDERLPVAKHLINFTDRIFSAVISKDKWFVRARNFSLPFLTEALMKYPRGKRMLFKFISQLNIHYHPNLLVKLKSGDRAPDGKIHSNVNVHDLLQGYAFHAIAFKKDGFTDMDVRMINHNMDSLGVKNIHLFRMVDEDDGHSMRVPLQVFRSFDVDEQVLFLVRPDGHIGYCSSEFGSRPDYLVFNKPEQMVLEPSTL